MQPKEWIKLEECKEGHLYLLHSRNLTLGVFNGVDGFVGIRQKFSSRFLDREFHWDTGAPYGTAKPLEDLGEVPEGVEAKTSLGAVDETTGRPVAFDQPVSSGGKGWYFTDTHGDPSLDIIAVSVRNTALYEYLEQSQKKAFNRRALTVIRCAIADLEGLLPEEDKDERTHPGWDTLYELALLEGDLLRESKCQ
jgi:hypothetical protein